MFSVLRYAAVVWSVCLYRNYIFSHKKHDFQKNFEHKMRALVFSTIFVGEMFMKMRPV
jgi:hypothetical protein